MKISSQAKDQGMMLSTLKVFQNSDTSVDTENVLQNSLNCNLEQI